jgi:hypothetical protein
MHPIGGRMWGFTQELFADAGTPGSPPAPLSPEDAASRMQRMAERFPNIVLMATTANHDEGSVVGHGCDDEFEFEFTLDLLLDSFDRLREQDWSSREAKRGRELRSHVTG